MKILIVHENALDYDLIFASLHLLMVQKPVHCTGFDAYKKLVADQKFDVVLCDREVDGFKASDYLVHFRKGSQYAPFIVVGSALKNSEVVSMLHGGITDAISIQHLDRLNIAIDRAVREFQNRADLEKVVADLKEREEVLKRNEEKYRKVVENQSEMIVRWDISGKVHFANQSFLKYHEVDFADFAKGSYYEFVNDTERFNKKIASLTVSRPEIIDVHMHFDKKRGNVWHEWSDHAFFGPGGEIAEIQSIGRDITVQKNAEIEIRENDEFNEGILSALDSNIAVIDKHGLIIATNATWRAFAMENNRLVAKANVGVNYFQACEEAVLSGDEYAAKAIEGIRAVLNKEADLFQMEYPCHSDTERRWFNMRVTPFSTNLDGAVISHYDISEKKRQDAELENSYKEILSVEKINRALIDGKSAPEISALILEGLYETVGITQSRIYLYDEPGNALTLFAQKISTGVNVKVEKRTGITPKNFIPVPTAGTVFGDCISSRSHVVTDHPKEIREIVAEHTTNKVLKVLASWATRIARIKTFGVYPLVDRDRTIGVLTIGSTILLNDQEKNLVVRYANQVAAILSKKMQEQELANREKLLNETQAIGRLGSWTWNPETGAITMSPQMKVILGIESETDFRSVDQLLSMIHPDFAEKAKRVLHNATHDFKSKEYEIKVVTRSGKEKILLIRAGSHAYVFGSNHPIYGTALDITEIRQSHERMLKSEFRFKKIFESIPDVYYQTTLEGEINLVSPSIFNLLGYQPGEMLGKKVMDYYADPKIREINLARLGEADGSVEFEAALKAKDGSEVIASIYMARHYYNNSWVFHGFLRNITERKRQEIKLESRRLKLMEANKLNTQIIETSDRIFYVHTVEQLEGIEHPLKYVSPQVRSVTGLPVSEFMETQKGWSGLIHPDDKIHLEEAMASLFEHQQPVEAEYRVFNRSVEEYIWVEDYVCPFIDEDGQIIELYGSVKDITERKSAEEKIENEKRQALAYQFQLLSSQLNPHFIYNTLNSFQYYILNGNIEESLNHISEFSFLMRKMLENSMSQHITLDSEIGFFKQYVDISRQRMKEPLKFTVTIDPDIDPAEHFIPPMLLQPYIENAIIHGFVDTKRPPVLNVSIVKVKDRIFCSVEDNGIGRPASKKQRNVREQFGQQSFAMSINQKRINLLNQVTKNDFKVEVLDLLDHNGDPAGTRVVLNYREIREEQDGEDF